MTVPLDLSRPTGPHCLFTLEQIRAFREVAKHCNLTLAALELQLSKSTVSKCMTELEQQVGVKLLNRSTRAVSLTDAGQVLLRRSQSVVDLTARIHSELRARATS